MWEPAKGTTRHLHRIHAVRADPAKRPKIGSLRYAAPQGCPGAARSHAASPMLARKTKRSVPKTMGAERMNEYYPNDAGSLAAGVFGGVLGNGVFGAEILG